MAADLELKAESQDKLNPSASPLSGRPSGKSRQLAGPRPAVHRPRLHRAGQTPQRLERRPGPHRAGGIPCHGCTAAARAGQLPEKRLGEKAANAVGIPAAGQGVEPAEGLRTAATGAGARATAPGRMVSTVDPEARHVARLNPISRTDTRPTSPSSPRPARSPPLLSLPEPGRNTKRPLSPGSARRGGRAGSRLRRHRLPHRQRPPGAGAGQAPAASPSPPP